MLNIYFSFSIISFCLGLLFLIKRKGDRYAYNLMALLLWIFSYQILYSVLYWAKKIPVVLDLTFYLCLALAPPVFYFYLRRIIKKVKIGRRDYYHALSTIIVLLCLGYYFIQPLRKKNFIRENGLINEYVFLDSWIDWILIGFMIFYVVKSYLLINNVSKDLDLTIWIKYTTHAFLGIVTSNIIYNVLAYSGVLTFTQDFVISIMIILFISLIGYLAFMQPQVFNGLSINKVIPITLKYKKTGLTKSLALELKKKLELKMVEEQLYLDNSIGLYDIANALNVSRNHASQVINEHFNLSFYDFVNKYRIEEAKNMIDNKVDLNFTQIAYTVGFNNRVSFYNAFKKFTGTSPTNYSRNLKVS